jgi:uncharacterized protein YqeY
MGPSYPRRPAHGLPLTSRTLACSCLVLFGSHWDRSRPAGAGTGHGVPARSRRFLRGRRVNLGSCMTIQEQIEIDLKDAMRAREAERLSVLRMAKSALMNATIEKYGAGGKLSDPETLAVLRKQVKQREDSIAGFEKGGRPELAEKEKREMVILSHYLPKALSEAEITALVQEAIAEGKATSKAQMGQVMKIATEKAAGRVDGKTLSQFVRDALP